MAGTAAGAAAGAGDTVAGASGAAAGAGGAAAGAAAGAGGTAAGSTAGASWGKKGCMERSKEVAVDNLHLQQQVERTPLDCLKPSILLKLKLKRE